MSAFALYNRLTENKVSISSDAYFELITLLEKGLIFDVIKERLNLLMKINNNIV